MNAPGASAARGIGFTSQRTRDRMVERLRAEVARTAGSAELRKRYQDLGIDLVASNSTEEFAAFLKKHVEEFTRLARDAGLTAP